MANEELKEYLLSGGYDKIDIIKQVVDYRIKEIGESKKELIDIGLMGNFLYHRHKGDDKE